MSFEKLRPNFTFTEDRLRELQSIVPEAFADGKINWDSLREALGEYLEEEGQEHFGLSWPGKREARWLATMPSKGTIVPKSNEGVNEENTHNIFIEGDNLEVLKLLQKSYAGRIKAIYIDPPYNTGNDFVYPDDFSEPLENYLRKIGQIDERGRTLSTNTKINGRFHSNWLSMIYPRLLLARQLLQKDGVIFVSIDDNEEHHLRIVLNEVFGEENFRANISWQKKYSVSNNQKGISSLRDIILVYSASSQFENGLLPRTEESKARYINPDNDPRGPWKPVDYWNPLSPEERPNLVYPITNPNTGKVINPTKKAWKFSKEVYEDNVKTNRLWWGQNGTNSVPALKLFLSEVRDGMIPHNWWPFEDAGHTDEAKKELQDLFNGISPFDTPKPVRLLKRICQIANLKDGDIVLDFFAGSCTTAHAVLQLNHDEINKIQFIMVQLPEPTPLDSPARKAGFNSIAEIGKDRVRRVIRKMRTESEEQINLLGKDEDLGFKVLCLDRSHFKDWQPYVENNSNQLSTLFDQFETPLMSGWKHQSLLTEILLLQGFPLDSKIRTLPAFHENNIQEVTHDSCAHQLYVCLDEKISQSSVDSISIRPEDIFVCLDSAMSDEDKIRLSDRCNLKVI